MSARLNIESLASRIVASLGICALWRDAKRTPHALVIKVIYIGLALYRLLAQLKTIGAKPVHWLARCVIGIERVNKNSSSNFLKLVTRGFGIPLFVVHDFLFKLSFNFGQCLVLGLGSKQLGLDINQAVLNVSNSLLRFDIFDSFESGCSSFSGCIEGSPSGRDFSKHQGTFLAEAVSNYHTQAGPTPIGRHPSTNRPVSGVLRHPHTNRRRC